MNIHNDDNKTAPLKNDEQKFSKLYDEYNEHIFRFLLSKTRNYEDALDLVQDVFSKIFEKINILDESRNIKSYLFTLANNKCIDYFRGKKEHDNIDDFKDFIPAKPLTDKTNMMAIATAMKKLTPREKEVFELKYFFNYKIIEIAEKLNISDGSVKRYLFDATLKLKESANERL